MLTKQHLMAGRRAMAMNQIAHTMGFVLGVEPQEAVTTHSFYFVYRGGEIRYSDHTKFGRQQATDILAGGSLEDTIRKFRVAALAAAHGLTAHAEVYRQFGKTDAALAAAAGF
jgi:hypothetical protein